MRRENAIVVPSRSIRKMSARSSRPSSAYRKENKKKADDSVEEKLAKANLKIKTLEQQLILQVEQTVRANSARNELRLKVEDFQINLENEKQDHMAVFSEMTRQYKSMQELLISKINDLELELLETKEQLEIAHLVLEETKKEKDRQLSEKESVIAEQSRKMEHMALEFSEMLKETLEKMGERIEEAAKVGSRDTSSLSLLEHASKLQEFNIRL